MGAPGKSAITVRRFIRNRTSGLFLCEAGEWSSDFTRAKAFPDTSTLVHSALLLPQTDLEELLMLGDKPSEFDVVLPLNSGKARQPRW